MPQCSKPMNIPLTLICESLDPGSAHQALVVVMVILGIGIGIALLAICVYIATDNVTCDR